MPIKEIKTNNAPAPLGPYSQGICSGNFVFLSGQIPLNPAGEIVDGDIKTQTKQVIKNISAVLEVEGMNLSNIVQTTVYLKDMAQFKDFNEAYAQFFKPPFPARATVQVSELPKGVKIEISAIAKM